MTYSNYNSNDKEKYPLNKNIIPKVPSSQTEVNQKYPPNLTLKFVQVIHRHGERTPIQSYLPPFISPNFPLCNIKSSFHASLSDSTIPTKPVQHSQSRPAEEKQYISQDNLKSLSKIQRVIEEQQPFIEQQGCLFGQLTDKGRETLFQLGKSLRDIYITKLNFLPFKISSSECYFRTTDYPRTLESIHHLIGGLYPNSSAVVYTRWLHEETMFAGVGCKKWRKAINDFKKAYKESNVSHIEKLKEKHFKLYKNTINSEKEVHLHGLYDTFISMHAHDLKIPITEDELRELEVNAYKCWFDVYRWNKEATRLSIGRFIKELREKITDVVEGKSLLKLAVYAGHDSTLAPLTAALEVSDGKWPPYASNVIIELFEKKDGSKDHEKFVRVIYNGEVKKIPYCAIKGNNLEDGKEEFCTLKAFFELTEQVTLTGDYGQECQL